MKKLSIEYAHIYTNNQAGEDQRHSLEILGEVTGHQDRSQISLAVMIDDYSFPDTRFDYREFNNYLSHHGYKPDVNVRESQLIPVCDTVLGLINDERLKSELTDYIEAHKYPCSLFIASWYLLRLGHVTMDILDQRQVAERLLNILPESFKPFEDKALEIIRATHYAPAAEHIDYKFFAGRAVGGFGQSL